MGIRCCRAELDTDGGSSPPVLPPKARDLGQAFCTGSLESKPKEIAEPSTTALIAVLAIALVAALVVIVFFPKPKSRAKVPAPAHVCHTGGNLLIRCDDDM
jgi:hypothetical protein